MTVQWKGDGDMTLHRLDRGKLIEQMLWIKRNVGEYKDSEIFELDCNGKRHNVVRVKEDVNGVFVHTLEQSFGTLLKFAPFMGSELKVLDFDEVLELLKQGVSEDVWLQWPDENPRTVIGKVLAVKVGDTLTVSLTPVPKDIEEVNREVHRRVAEKCSLAKDGMECGACPLIAGCEALKEADDEIKREREGRGKGRPEDARKGEA